MASTTPPWQQLEHEESRPSRQSYGASRPQHHAIRNDETGRWEATPCYSDDEITRSHHRPHRAGCVPVLDGDDCRRNHRTAATSCRKDRRRSSFSCPYRAHHSTVTFTLFTILLLIPPLLAVVSGHHDGYGFESNRDHVIPTETDDRDVGTSFGISPINYTLQFPSCGSTSTFRPSVEQLRLFEGATESFLGSALAQVFPGGRGGFQQLELYANDYILWDDNNRGRRKIEEVYGDSGSKLRRRRAQFREEDPPMVVTLLFSGNAKFRYTPPVDAVGEVAHVCEYMLTYHMHGLVDEIRRTFSNADAQARVVGSSVDTNVCAPNNFGTTSSVLDVAPGSIPAGHGSGGDKRNGNGNGNGNEEGVGVSNEMAPTPTHGGGGNKRVPRPQGGPSVNNDDGGGGSSRQPGPQTLAAESDTDGEGDPSSPSMGMLLGIVGSAGAALALVSLGAVYLIRLRREEAETTDAISSNGGGPGGSKKTRRQLEPMGGDGSTSSSVGDDLGMTEEDGDYLGSFRNDSVNDRNDAGYWDQVSTSLASGRGPRPEHERGGDGGDGHPDGNFVSGGAENSETQQQQQQQHPHQQHPQQPQQQQQQQPPPQQQQQQQQKLMERTVVGRIDDLDHPCDQRSTIPSVVSVPSASASSSSSSEACSSKGWSSARSHDGSHDEEEEEHDDEGVQTSANDRPTSNYMYGASGEDAGSCHSTSGSSGSVGSSCDDHDSWVATEDKMVVDDSAKIHNDQDRPQDFERDSEDRTSVVTIEEIRQAKLPPATTTAAEVSSVGRRPPPAPMYKSSSAGAVVTPPKAAKRVTVSEPAAPVRASSETQICGPGTVFKTVVLGGVNKGKRGGENCDQSYGNTASMTTATSATDSLEENSRDRNTSVLRGPSFRWLRSKGGSRGHSHHRGTMEIEDDRLSMSAFSIGSHEDHHFTATQHPEEEARRRIMAVRDGSSRLMMINRSSSSEWDGGGGDGRHHQRRRSQAQSQSRRGSSSSFLHAGRIRRVSIASSMSMASSSGDAAEDTMNKAGSEIRRYTRGDGDGGPRGPHAGPITEEDRALTRMMMARSRSRRTQRG